jgi:putative acetyltransferase
LWLEETIAKLKADDFQNLDIENLIEELEGLAGRDRRELESRLNRLIEIRRFRFEDAEQVAALFHHTVREVNRADYSLSQVQAWAPDDLGFRNWAEVCRNRITYVADLQSVIVGFGELVENLVTNSLVTNSNLEGVTPNHGYIDCFYCHHQYQRLGIGTRLYQTIEATALDLGMTHLTVAASITARPFFERMGFVVQQSQYVNCRGEVFLNYLMAKNLP